MIVSIEVAMFAFNAMIELSVLHWLVGKKYFIYINLGTYHSTWCRVT